MITLLLFLLPFGYTLALSGQFGHALAAGFFGGLVLNFTYWTLRLAFGL